MTYTRTNLTLQEFLALSEGDTACELIDGRAVPKVSPKLFHSTVQLALLLLFLDWCEGKGRVIQEWAVLLQRDNKDMSVLSGCERNGSRMKPVPFCRRLL
jgi:Uma2 family endonuclease